MSTQLGETNLFTRMEYGTGFIVLAVVIFIRLLNLYTNHVLKQPEQYKSFPFRIP